MSFFLSSCGFVDQEGGLALLEREVDEAVTLMHSVAAEALPEEDMPVGLPVLIHVLLHYFRDLQPLIQIKRGCLPACPVLRSRAHREPSWTP